MVTRMAKLALFLALAPAPGYAQCFELVELPPVSKCTNPGYAGSADFTMGCKLVHGGYAEMPVACPPQNPAKGSQEPWGNPVDMFGGGVGGSGGAGGGDANGGPSGF